MGLEYSTMERRQLLKGIGGIGTLAAVGGASFLLSGSAAATGGMDFGSASLSSDDGTVDHVAIFGDGRVEWDGFETEAKSFNIITEIGGDRLNNRVQINESGPHDLTASSWGGSNETFSGAGTSGYIESDIGYGSGENRNENSYWIIVAPKGDPSQANHPASDYGLPMSAVEAAKYEVGTDGKTNNYNIKVHTTYQWFDDTTGSGNLIFEKTFTSNITLTVTNEPQTASSSAPEEQEDNEEGVVAG
jgi:hypothetical protein